MSKSKPKKKAATQIPPAATPASWPDPAKLREQDDWIMAFDRLTGATSSATPWVWEIDEACRALHLAETVIEDTLADYQALPPGDPGRVALAKELAKVEEAAIKPRQRHTEATVMWREMLAALIEIRQRYDENGKPLKAAAAKPPAEKSQKPSAKNGKAAKVTTAKPAKVGPKQTWSQWCDSVEKATQGKVYPATTDRCKEPQQWRAWYEAGLKPGEARDLWQKQNAERARANADKAAAELAEPPTRQDGPEAAAQEPEDGTAPTIAIEDFEVELDEEELEQALARDLHPMGPNGPIAAKDLDKSYVPVIPRLIGALPLPRHVDDPPWEFVDWAVVGCSNRSGGKVYELRELVLQNTPTPFARVSYLDRRKKYAHLPAEEVPLEGVRVVVGEHRIPMALGARRLLIAVRDPEAMAEQDVQRIRPANPEPVGAEQEA